MAGIGKYKKGAAFTLKSGNKPSFAQMGSGLSPGKYKTTPLLAEDETPKVKEGDSKAVKLGKVLGNMAIGGSNAALGTKIHEFKINRGENEEKIDKEAEVKTIGQKVESLLSKDLTSTFAEFTSDGKIITSDDPRHSNNITKKKSFQG